MKTFTLYRPTIAFLEQAQQDQTKALLFAERTGFFTPTPEALQVAFNAISTLFNEKHLIAVATVNCEHINDLYRLTHCPDDETPWFERPEVTRLADIEPTTLDEANVGDLFSDEAGQFYFIKPLGLQAISQDKHGIFRPVSKK